MEHAALECTGWFSLEGRVPEPWDRFSGLYRCADGWVRLHQLSRWLRALGRVADGFAVTPPSRSPFLESSDSGFGELVAIRPSAQLERTPAHYSRPSVRPGHSPPHG